MSRIKAGVSTLTSGQLKRVLSAVVIASAMFAGSVCIIVLRAPKPLYPDFFGLWTFGQMAITADPTSVYDNSTLYEFQHRLGMDTKDAYPFLYPPWILLLLAPLGVLPFALAMATWLGLTFTGYIASALRPNRLRSLTTALLLLAPSTAVCLLPGQTGFLTAGLLLGGLRLLRRRPAMAGVMLGSLILKPQFFVMVPVVLLAHRSGKAIAGAVLAVLGLTIATFVVFGHDIWSAWIESKLYRPMLLPSEYRGLLPKKITVASAAQMLGAQTSVAYAIQAIFVVVAIVAVWRVRGRSDPTSSLVVVLSTLLATPYAFYYDLPMLTGAVVALMAARLAEDGRFGVGELLLLLACLEAPTLPFLSSPLSFVLPVVFALTAWTYVRRDPAHDAPALPITT